MSVLSSFFYCGEYLSKFISFVSIGSYKENAPLILTRDTIDLLMSLIS